MITPMKITMTPVRTIQPFLFKTSHTLPRQEIQIKMRRSPGKSSFSDVMTGHNKSDP